MNRTGLLTAIAAFALTAGVASASDQNLSVGAMGSQPFSHTAAGSKKVLWSQNSNGNGDGVNSQNYISRKDRADDTQAADDFVIPKGQTWTVTEVDVTGTYSEGSGPAASENVYFYKNLKKSGIPGKLVSGGKFKNLNGKGGPSFAIDLGKGVKLTAGHYWVSVVANCTLNGCGEWNWMENGTVTWNEAVWQQPHGAPVKCPSWGTVDVCLNEPGDLEYALRGSSTER